MKLDYISTQTVWENHVTYTKEKIVGKLNTDHKLFIIANTINTLKMGGASA